MPRITRSRSEAECWTELTSTTQMFIKCQKAGVLTDSNIADIRRTLADAYRGILQMVFNESVRFIVKANEIIAARLKELNIYMSDL